MKQLDLGAAAVMRQQDGVSECWGVDVVPVPANPRIRVADLNLDPIPFGDDEFDLVTAFDVMEHIEGVLYVFSPVEGRMVRTQPIVRLFNEIYRVLKPRGEFLMRSPVYPHREVFQDPTHVFFWTDETPNYFSGDYYGFRHIYGHTSHFEKLYSKKDGAWLELRLRARKGD